VSVPPNTTDPQIEALLFRFRAALESDRDGFGRLKIKPTTPNDPGGHYQRVTIYVLDNPGLAEESVLRDYLAGDPAARGAFKRSVRGIYRLTPGMEIGVLGYADEDVYFTRPPQALLHPPTPSLPNQALIPKDAPLSDFTRPPQARRDAPLPEAVQDEANRPRTLFQTQRGTN